MSTKAKAMLVLQLQAVKAAHANHERCKELPFCLHLEDLRLAAIGYTLAMLQAISEKRDDATKKEGQADRAQMAAVVAELQAALDVLQTERRAYDATPEDFGPTQAPGVA